MRTETMKTKMMKTRTDIDEETFRQQYAAPSARWLADLYCLWRLCGKTACLRARACNGDLRHCQRALPLVPDDARHFMMGFEHGREDKLTFDEMIDLYAEELYALENWRALVMTTLARR
jgi:hypothetical protein